MFFLGSSSNAIGASFDFEDGSQGWDLGSVSRSTGSPLGSPYAIYGEGGAMSIEIDLTPFDSLVWSQFFTGDELSRQNFILVAVTTEDPGPIFFLGGTSLVTGSAAPVLGFDRRVLDLTWAQGPHTVTLAWANENSVPLQGWVDDVVFLPEPRTGALMLLVLLAIALRARRLTRQCS